MFKKTILLLVSILSLCGLPACSGGEGGALDNISVVSSPLDFTNDPENCGATGYACVGGRDCVDSVCSPAWIVISDIDAPSERRYAASAELNGQYVIYGGCALSSAFDDGFAYDPATDTWSALSPMATARAGHSLASTDAGIYAMGGLTDCSSGNSTGPVLEVLYTESSDWQPVEVLNGLLAYNSQMIFTGSELFHFGGGTTGAPAVTDGKILALGTDWQDYPCDVENCERGEEYSMFYTYPYAYVWGGGDGLSFDTVNKTWAAWQVPANTPDISAMAGLSSPPRYADDGRRLFYPDTDGTVKIFDRDTETWSTDSTAAPTGFCNEGPASWVGGEMIQWGGMCDIPYMTTVGVRYQPPAP